MYCRVYRGKKPLSRLKLMVGNGCGKDQGKSNLPLALFAET